MKPYLKQLISVLCLSAAPVAIPAAFATPVSSPTTETAVAAIRARQPEDEIIYFLLPDRFENGDTANDRGGLTGGRLKTGFDPASKAFFNGGDFKGVEKRLDYIKSLGATAVWLAPVFRNKPVQGPKGDESAGYHGYWIVDFTRTDPHFGSNAEFKHLVDAVHAHGLKFYMDIVANHTADIIQYKECSANCLYRSRSQYPYSRRGGVSGAPINSGFMGDTIGTAENFAHLTRPDYAYTPFIPKGEKHAKVPDWLNDPIYYHNRGNSTFSGESSTMGDFSGLDDLMTENPRVVQGMIDIYGAWIDTYRIDGFRVDTEQHVNPEFWQAFVAAMMARAKADGIPNFHIFGEVGMGEVDVAKTARHSREDGMADMLDYPFAIAMRQVVAGRAGTRVLARLFADDVLYQGGRATAMRLPTFISNHDQGRFGWFIRSGLPHATDAEVTDRIILAHAMMLSMRGVPVIYYGDEQGFPGTGGDQAAREDMFASKVALYNSEDLLGTTTTTAVAHFGHDNPIFKAIAKLDRIRTTHPALTRGTQIVRNYSDQPGLFAVSRMDPRDGHEILALFNTSDQPLDTLAEISPASHSFTALAGTCAAKPVAPGSYPVRLAPRGYAICEAERAK